MFDVIDALAVYAQSSNGLLRRRRQSRDHHPLAGFLPTRQSATQRTLRRTYHHSQLHNGVSPCFELYEQRFDWLCPSAPRNSRTRGCTRVGHPVHRQHESRRIRDRPGKSCRKQLSMLRGFDQRMIAPRGNGSAFEPCLRDLEWYTLPNDRREKRRLGRHAGAGTRLRHTRKTLLP
jgi:hypothetical protein